MFTSYKTKFDDGTPTDFVGKVLTAYALIGLGKGSTSEMIFALGESVRKAHDRGLIRSYVRGDGSECCPSFSQLTEMYTPKIHTLRENVDRWRVGLDVEPVIGNRTPNLYRFAPPTPFIASQKVEMELVKNVNGEVGFLRHLYISIDGGSDLSDYDVRRLIKNDGLNWRTFAEWFFGTYPGDPDTLKAGTWKGGIIHHTKLLY